MYVYTYMPELVAYTVICYMYIHVLTFTVTVTLLMIRWLHSALQLLTRLAPVG